MPPLLPPWSSTDVGVVPAPDGPGAEAVGVVGFPVGTVPVVPSSGVGTVVVVRWVGAVAGGVRTDPPPPDVLSSATTTATAAAPTSVDDGGQDRAPASPRVLEAGCELEVRTAGVPRRRRRGAQLGPQRVVDRLEAESAVLAVRHGAGASLPLLGAHGVSSRSRSAVRAACRWNFTAPSDSRIDAAISRTERSST